MFDNIGEKIKKLAMILCWCGIGASVIFAIIMFATAVDSYRMEGFYIMMGFVYLIVGPLLSWVSSFFAYGFGELVENSKTSTYNICLILQLMNKIEPKQNETKTVKETSSYHPTPTSINLKNSSEFWVCKKCGIKNEINAHFCKDCGEYK